MQKHHYSKFLLMLTCAALAMYITMYFNTYEMDHVFFSWTRMYMTFIGLGAMGIIMLLFMIDMYQDKMKNTLILVGSILLMLTSTILVRQQIPVEDVRWMKAMIPHHSIAILTSNRAQLSDPEVKELAQQIIRAQEKEIKEMKRLLDKLENQ